MFYRRPCRQELGLAAVLSSTDGARTLMSNILDRRLAISYGIDVKDSLQIGLVVSFQAKSTVVTMIAMVGAYGWYGVTVSRLATDSPVSAISYQPLVFIVAVPLVVLATIGHIAISALNPSEADSSDERDREIARRGGVVGGWVVSAAALAALFASMAELDYFWLAQLLIAGLVLAELADGAWRLVLYRRGV